MKKIIHAWNKASLIKRILIGMLVGGILGLTLPNISGIGLLGDLFVGGLKAIAPILVFALVANALSQHQKGQNEQHENGYLPLLGRNLCSGTCCCPSKLHCPC